ncbi:hypothetical protein PPROV_000641900 [Pycnococcus provasolii]|uniref:Uncharacterized protein n=1 Tax=Pycnococcus provasolii TaxID=41880 RepID=A0A830HRU7_9CHLO|nr:hypothetical protein PPROV_000641900 [Pycnococcus provasolii]
MTCRSTPRAVSTARCRRGVPRKSIWYSGIVPDVLSVDRGTENGLCCRQVIYVERAVRAALGERQSERPPVFYTRSVHNTRIERFWPELNVRFTLLAQRWNKRRREKADVALRRVLYLKTLMEILEEKRARDDEIRARDEDALIGPRGHILKTIELFNADNSMADVKQHSTFVNVDAMQLDTGSSNRRRVAAAAVLHHYTATPGSTRCT